MATKNNLQAVALFLLGILLPSLTLAESKIDNACIDNPSEFVWTHEEGSARGMTRFSLNLGKKQEPIVFIAANSSIGNGGGTYHAFRTQGKCYFHLGTLFLQRDAFQVLKTKHHGLSDIKSYNHMSSRTGTLTTYQFDGTKYIQNASHEIRSKDFDKEISPTRLLQVETTEDGEHWHR